MGFFLETLNIRITTSNLCILISEIIYSFWAVYIYLDLDLFPFAHHFYFFEQHLFDLCTLLFNKFCKLLYFAVRKCVIT